MRILRELTLFALLLAFWLLLSGQYNALFVGMGIVSAAIATWAGTRLVERTIGPAAEHPRVNLLRLALYLGWLFGRMVASALQVAWIVLNPRVPPRPGIVRFASELSSPAARTVLANSITLVPGTMTLEIDEGELTVHTFTPEAADDLASARMQNRIAGVFRDDPQHPPEMMWESDGSASTGGDPR